jgi:predicted nucleic acid-binding protein
MDVRPLIVLDTDVLESALRSRRGASFAVLSQVGTGAFDIAVSVSLVLEYEAVLMRQAGEMGRPETAVVDLIDYLCSVAKRQAVFFLWRPFLTDPDDDMVLELAVAAGCDAIVTHNGRDFQKSAEFGISVLSPAEFLRKIGANS